MVGGLATTIREQVNPNAGDIRVVRRVTPKRNRSTKQIWKLCSCCHKGRWVYYSDLSRPRYTGMCRKCYESNYRHTEEEKAKISKAQIGRVSGMKGKRHSQETKLKISEGERTCGRDWSKTEQTRRKIRNTLKRRILENPQLLQKLIAQASTACRRPNKAEIKLCEILSPFGFHYTGDGSHNVGTLAPDFWNGNHKVIELYGDYWHRHDDPQERINAFAQYDYKCLVIWESEMKTPENVILRVKEFCDA